MENIPFDIINIIFGYSIKIKKLKYFFVQNYIINNFRLVIKNFEKKFKFNIGSRTYYEKDKINLEPVLYLDKILNNQIFELYLENQDSKTSWITDNLGIFPIKILPDKIQIGNIFIPKNQINIYKFFQEYKLIIKPEFIRFNKYNNNLIPIFKLYNYSPITRLRQNNLDPICENKQYIIYYDMWNQLFVNYKIVTSHFYKPQKLTNIIKPTNQIISLKNNPYFYQYLISHDYYLEILDFYYLFEGSGMTDILQIYLQFEIKYKLDKFKFNINFKIFLESGNTYIINIQEYLDGITNPPFELAFRTNSGNIFKIGLTKKNKIRFGDLFLPFAANNILKKFLLEFSRLIDLEFDSYPDFQNYIKKKFPDKNNLQFIFPRFPELVGFKKINYNQFDIFMEELSKIGLTSLDIPGYYSDKYFIVFKIRINYLTHLTKIMGSSVIKRNRL